MNNNTVEDYARKIYKNMLKEPVGRLKHKFIIPGCYGNALWDWDSWLTDVALRQFADEDISEYEKGCIKNYLDCIDEKGRVPITIQEDNYYPENFTDINAEFNIHKPCLIQHAAFISQSIGDAGWLAPYYPKLAKFADYYIDNCKHKTGIYFWMDDWAIGVDNDPCTFYRPPKSSGSIFLNCLMYKELEALCYIGERLGENTEKYREEMISLRDSVREHCYDEKDGFFYSVDLNLLPITNEWLHSGAPRHWDCLIQRIGSWSGFMALWSGIATKEQAERTVKENLLDPNGFWAEYGVRTLSKYEKMYSVKASGNPSCWLGPIWGVSNYLVFRGLVKYGFDSAAEELAQKTVKLFENDIADCGQMHEYYDPETGKPIINPGFMNWNLLSVNMKAWLDGNEVVTEF